MKKMANEKKNKVTFEDSRPVHDEKLHVRALYEYCKENNIDSTKLSIEEVKELGFYY